MFSLQLPSNEGPDPKPEFTTDNRTYRVWMDPNQYQLDMTATVNGEEVITLFKDIGLSIENQIVLCHSKFYLFGFV